MESSDSEDEGDGAENQGGSQMDRLIREEDYYRFVNNLSEGDYKLMRDNSLLGIPGECTEEELLRRLQLVKDNSPQNSNENPGGRDSSDDVSSGDSVIDWLNNVRQTENMTGDQRENQFWSEENQNNPDGEDFILYLERNGNHNNESPDRENEYAPSITLHETENTEDSQSQMENLPPSESTFTRTFRWEQNTTEASVEASTSRGQRRARSRSPDHRRTRARIESRSPPNPVSEISQGFPLRLRSWTLYELLRSEIVRSSAAQHQETSRQQVTRPDLQNRDPFVTSEMGNTVQEESSSDTTSIGESWGSRPMDPTLLSDPEEGRVQSTNSYQEDSIAAGTQLTSERPNNTDTVESEGEELSHTSSHSEQPDRIPFHQTRRYFLHRFLSAPFDDIPFSAIQNTSEQTMTGFSDSSNLVDSDIDLAPNVSPPSLNIERAESPNGRDGSGNSSSSDVNEIPNYFHSSSPLISSSSSNYVSSSSSTPMSSSSSSENISEISSLLFEGSDHRSESGLSENTTESRPMTPVMFDESDSWTSLHLDQFFLFEEDQHQSTGLTKAQIDNLAITSFGENDALKSCSVCIIEFTEGNRIRKLPCSHEYHVHCIDRWLSENTTCPICRREVVVPDERENPN
ncbi:E3 ubiquitin-protein ligase RLIM [Galemys pyrenaicus]|uniref:RING-type E3 ubiquitin transferase n=1 Tax=Galemys pyrenaicus TaxID=202257 RepID=A0A8J5ZWN5_GALPY|nr:E3 ubiquitin-protein ligase RLIM [Galemys pyrenaicus]